MSGAPCGRCKGQGPGATAMTCVDPVPKLYRSVIEDVIEGVWDLFAEEGIEEQVLKDLKQVCRQYSFLFLLFLHLKKLKL